MVRKFLNEEKSIDNVESFLITVSNYVAAKLVTDSRLKEGLLSIYEENEDRLKKLTLKCLDDYVPAIFSLPVQHRTDCIKITSLLYYATTDKGKLLYPFMTEYIQILHNNRDMNSYNNFIAYTLLSEEPDRASNFDKPVFISMAIYCYEDIVNGNLEEEEFKTHFMDLKLREWVDFFNTNVYSRLKYDMEEVRETLKECPLIFRHKNIISYIDDWNENFLTCNDIEGLEEVAVIDPFNMYVMASMYSGMQAIDGFDSALITKKMINEAAFSVLQSYQIPETETISEKISLSEWKKTRPLTQLNELQKMIEDKNKRAKDAKLLGKRRIRENTPDEFAFTQAFMFALLFRYMASKHVADVKAVIKRELDPPKKAREKNKSIAKQQEKGATKTAVLFKNEAMEKEIAELKKQVATLQDRLNSSKNREAAITSRYEKLEQEYDELLNKIPVEEIQVEEIIEEEKEFVSTAQAFDISDETDCYLNLTLLLQKYKVTIVGGNPNTMTRFTAEYPDVRAVDDKRLTTCEDLLKKSDIILFKTDCMSHSLWNKGKSVSNAFNIPFGYIDPVTSPDLMAKSAYKAINKIVADNGWS